MKLKKNDVLALTVEDITNLGFGVAKIDGMSVFVADTVTGDEAEIKIIKTAKTYADARRESEEAKGNHKGVAFGKRL